MKEQDAAHSLDEGSETPLGFNVENVKDRANANIIHKLNEELTRLRSELQQERELRKEIIKASNELLRYDSSMKYAMTEKLQYSGRFIESLEAFSEVIEKAKLNN